jgi:uncharacterized protein (TIRG00374 family)
MNQIKKKVKIKDVVKYLLMLALAGLLLYFAFRDISWNDFMEGLRSCNYWWILLSMVISWLVVILRGWRWRLMMRPLSKEITRLEAYDAYNICYLANLVLPRSGEVVRCGLIANSGKVSFEGVLGTVVLERIWDLICVVLVILPLFFFGTFKDFLIEKMWNPMVESLPFKTVWLVVGIILLIVTIVLIFRAYRKKIAATGAGDIYAAGFLYAHSMGMPLKICGEVGSIIAAKVVEVIGPKIDIPRWKAAKAEIRELIATYC